MYFINSKYWIQINYTLVSVVKQTLYNKQSKQTFRRCLMLNFFLKRLILNLLPSITFGFSATSHTLSQHMSLLSVAASWHSFTRHRQHACMLYTHFAVTKTTGGSGRQEKIPVKINRIFSGIWSAIKSPNKVHSAAGRALLCFALPASGKVTPFSATFSNATLLMKLIWIQSIELIWMKCNEVKPEQMTNLEVARRED